MAHDIVKDSVEAQTGRASLFIMGILAGGVLVAASYVADWIFGAHTVSLGPDRVGNSYSDILAMVGALLLGVPIIAARAAKHLLHGHMHMDELVALAVIAALTIERLPGGRRGGVLPAAGQPDRDPHRPGRPGEHRGPGPPGAQEGPPPRGTAGRNWSIPSELQPGDVVRVRPGDNIPADGVRSSPGRPPSTRPTSPANRCRWTRPSGDEVFTGTINLAGAMDVQRHPRRGRHHAGQGAEAHPPGREDANPDHAADRPLRRLVHPHDPDAGGHRAVLHATTTA